MDKKTKLFKKQDLILILLILAFAIAGGVWYWRSHQGPARIAEVYVGGELTMSLDLDKDQQITVDNRHGGTNQLTIEQGEIWCADASCPDKICIYQGKQSLDGSMIVCLPNKMVVTISEGRD